MVDNDGPGFIDARGIATDTGVAVSYSNDVGMKLIHGNYFSKFNVTNAIYRKERAKCKYAQARGDGRQATAAIPLTCKASRK
jgi:hypothetical protein